jgi:hypothetical protein
MSNRKALELIRNGMLILAPVIFVMLYDAHYGRVIHNIMSRGAMTLYVLFIVFWQVMLVSICSGLTYSTLKYEKDKLTAYLLLLPICYLLYAGLSVGMFSKWIITNRFADITVLPQIITLQIFYA